MSSRRLPASPVPSVHPEPLAAHGNEPQPHAHNDSPLHWRQPLGRATAAFGASPPPAQECRQAEGQLGPELSPRPPSNHIHHCEPVTVTVECFRGKAEATITRSVMNGEPADHPENEDGIELEIFTPHGGDVMTFAEAEKFLVLTLEHVIKMRNEMA
jgi:hypothetical protein